MEEREREELDTTKRKLDSQHANSRETVSTFELNKDRTPRNKTMSNTIGVLWTWAPTCVVLLWTTLAT